MKPQRPFPWIFYFLKLICPSHLIEEIEGDLIERFDNDFIKYGRARAKTPIDLERGPLFQTGSNSEKQIQFSRYAMGDLQTLCQSILENLHPE